MASTQEINTVHFTTRAPADRVNAEALGRMQTDVDEMRRRVAALDAHTSARMTAQAKRMDALNRRLTARLAELESRVTELESRDEC